MIRLIDVTKKYLKQSSFALNHINLTIEAGEVFGLIGKTGAGKSTLLRVINQLEKIDLGQVWVGEQEISTLSESDLRPIRHQIGMIFQHFNLLSSKTVFDNIALPLRFMKITKDEIQKRVAMIVEKVGLSDKIDTYPNQLSGGQKQRVAIARALVTRPQILLCDEATSALDPETTQAILDLLKNLQLEFQLTLIMVTHQMEVVKTICDRVAVMHQGEILEINSTENFFLRPTSAVGKALAQTALRENLPTHFEIPWQTQPLQHQSLFRIFFRHGTVQKPIISELMHQFKIHINILQANIEHLRQETIGIMIVLASGESSQIRDFFQHLQHAKIDYEIIENRNTL